MRLRRTGLAAGAMLVGGLLVGCTAPGGAHRPAFPPAATPVSTPVSTPAVTSTPQGALRASVNQFRPDEGTRRLRAGVSNAGPSDVRVTRATIAWAGLDFPTVRIPADPVHPGQTAAFTIAYGAPHCGSRPVGRPSVVAQVDGRRTVLRLHVDDPGLLDRLRAKACAQRRLDRVATVGLRLARSTVRSQDGERLPGTVVVTRRTAPGRVAVTDLDGSVLIVLVPRAGAGSLPATLPSGRHELRFPVLFGSAHRCDGHARGQSQQTFLFSAYVRLDGRPAQREVLALTSAERDRLIGLVDRDCD